MSFQLLDRSITVFVMPNKKNNTKKRGLNDVRVVKHDNCNGQLCIWNESERASDTKVRIIIYA